MIIERKIIDPRIADLPMYATPGSAGIDLRACTLSGIPIEQSFTIYPGGKAMIGAGFALHLEGLDDPTEIAALLLPRSGLGNRGMRLGNTVGLIDSDFQGELMMAVEWHGSDPLVINATERVAQLFVCPFIRIGVVDVTEFSNQTARGDGGFGSTGAK